jgi:hypothetical protein
MSSSGRLSAQMMMMMKSVRKGSLFQLYLIYHHHEPINVPSDGAQALLIDGSHKENGP